MTSENHNVVPISQKVHHVIFAQILVCTYLYECISSLKPPEYSVLTKYVVSDQCVHLQLENL